MNFLSIDPGSNSVGICYLCEGSALRFVCVNKSSSVKLSRIEADIDLITRVVRGINDLQVSHYIHELVMEEPKDAQPHWSKNGPMGLGSLFASGKGYGLCLAAVAHLRKYTGLTIERMYSYQVTTNKHGEGWQPRVKGGRNKNLAHTPRKVLLLQELRAQVAELWTAHVDGTAHVNAAMPAEQAKAAAEALSEHELMAYGVLRYHLQKAGAA